MIGNGCIGDLCLDLKVSTMRFDLIRRYLESPVLVSCLEKSVLHLLSGARPQLSMISFMVGGVITT